MAEDIVAWMERPPADPRVAAFMTRHNPAVEQAARLLLDADAMTPDAVRVLMHRTRAWATMLDALAEVVDRVERQLADGSVASQLAEIVVPIVLDPDLPAVVRYLLTGMRAAQVPALEQPLAQLVVALRSVLLFAYPQRTAAVNAAWSGAALAAERDDLHLASCFGTQQDGSLGPRARVQAILNAHLSLVEGRYRRWLHLLLRTIDPCRDSVEVVPLRTPDTVGQLAQALRDAIDEDLWDLLYDDTHRRWRNAVAHGNIRFEVRRDAVTLWNGDRAAPEWTATYTFDEVLEQHLALLDVVGPAGALNAALALRLQDLLTDGVLDTAATEFASHLQRARPALEAFQEHRDPPRLLRELDAVG